MNRKVFLPGHGTFWFLARWHRWSIAMTVAMFPLSLPSRASLTPTFSRMGRSSDLCA
jgi:hypothetical protein